MSRRTSRPFLAALLVLLVSGCAIFGFGGGERENEDEYVVEKGDTLYSIAEDHNIAFRDLAGWNDLKQPYTIRPGQVLRLTEPEGYVSRPAESRPIARPSEPRPEEPPSAGGFENEAAPPPVVAAPPSPPTSETNTASAAPPVPAVSPVRWRWPVQGELLRKYSPDEGNSGIDVGGALGDPVRAAANGRVVYGGSGLQGYGMLVIVKHDDNYLSAYGYNRKLLVQQGDEVHAGQPIAEMGEGPQRKPLVHFEIRRSGRTIDPLQVLPSH